MTDTLSIAAPFEAHVHGRQGNILKTVAPMTARQFWGAIFEPNLATPITTCELGRSYRNEIEEACKDYPSFKPYVLAYFTDTIEPDELAKGCSDGTFIGLKFYPRGATTNSDSGVTDVRTLYTRGANQYEAIKAVHAAGKVVQLHCELNFDLNGNELDPYDKERYFFAEIMPRLLDAHEGKFSCEHLTSEEGANFMLEHGKPGRLGCSITPHHLLYDRRDMFRGGLRPHFFCLPVIKRFKHQMGLWALIGSGASFAYAGTDSAPHDRRKKESDCCSGGVFSAHAAVEFYAKAFEGVGFSADFSYFERFMSVNGPAFYGLEQPRGEKAHVRLVNEPWTVDEMIRYSSDPNDIIRPLGYEEHPKAREPLHWKLQA